MSTLSNETVARLRAEVERNTAPFRTPDIAGLCERLRAITTTDHERLCQGREYVCSCGWDAENEAKATEAADTLERQAAEIERMQRLLNGRDDFIVAEGLWPKFCDGLPARAALTGEDA